MYSTSLLDFSQKKLTRTEKIKFKFLFYDVWNQLLAQTSFLPDNFTPQQRLYYVSNNIQSILTCPVCKNIITKWDNSKKKFSTTCSYKCHANYHVTTENKKMTNLQKYGVENPFQNDVIKQKIKMTNLQKYGVENPSQNKEINQKRNNTFAKCWGQHPLKDKRVIAKRTKTLEQKYGVSNISQSETFKQTKIKTHHQHFGYDYSSQSNTSKIIHLLDNEDWLREQHHTNKRPLNSIAEELKVDLTTIIFYIKKYNIEQKYYTQSQAERDIQQFFKNLNIKFVANTRQVIPPFELDIYIPEYNLAIEYCGLYWHSTAHERITKNYHKDKLDKCKNRGVRLLTIFEDEWVHKQDVVKQKILSVLHKDNRKKVFARKCDIVNVSLKDKTTFFEQNHIQGNGPGSITYGLVFDNKLVAAMTFIKQKDNKFILNRYATSAHVVGGFSRLLEHFKRNNQWREILSFADLRWSDGNLYEKNKFILDKILLPDYQYVDGSNIKRIHKFNFRHKNLNKILKNYNPTLSETQNTINNNWYKIYNCGLARYRIVLL
jgi:hypothetical protein